MSWRLLLGQSTLTLILRAELTCRAPQWAAQLLPGLQREKMNKIKRERINVYQVFNKSQDTRTLLINTDGKHA